MILGFKSAGDAKNAALSLIASILSWVKIVLTGRTCQWLFKNYYMTQTVVTSLLLTGTDKDAFSMTHFNTHAATVRATTGTAENKAHSK